MPAWKTFDESTADALKEHLGEAVVSTVDASGPLFDGNNSVLIAPTLQKGAAFVITARAKQKSAVGAGPAPQLQTAEPLPPQPVNEMDAQAVTPEPVPAPAPTGWLSVEPAGTQESPSAGSEADERADLTFGPTTWERVEVTDPVSIPIEPEGHSEITSSDPAVWDLPSEAPPPERWTDEIVAPPSDDDHHIATGFLGLDDYVEDEEEIARAKRPWWKKIFTD